ncbi:RNI-like protein [Piedraia hortae CBS 480.64]|uniref:RNI-like protein n=1 Tax=Piedraia hortae CBS 480.64 TaxID=1314780 RepID=A0A6A7BSC6_9PEZI|nr:RNI-like protein [Piedraia hortae CBS 480.64]
MAGRRSNGNRIRGPQSALTDFLAANNITAARFQGNRRAQIAAENEEDDDAADDNQDDDAADAEDEEEQEEEEEEEEQAETEPSRKRKRNAAALKRSKEAAERRFENGNFGGLGSKGRPKPGQFEHCEICGKRFTVTPYSQEGPNGGLLCGVCAAARKKDAKPKSRTVRQGRRKLASDRLDGVAGGPKSLTDLCMAQVARYHNDLEELGDLPEPLLEKLSKVFGKKRILSSATLPLFLRPELEAVVLHDAAYLEEGDYRRIFAEVPKVQRLVLGNACQFKDGVIDYLIERCHSLRHIKIYAANLVSSDAWKRLFTSLGPQLESIQLKYVDPSFDSRCVDAMVTSCPRLERLKLEHCSGLDDTAVGHLSHLKTLKYLSLQTTSPISTATLTALIEARGGQLQTLSLQDLEEFDDSLLQSIHSHCRNLTKLRLSNNCVATDAAYAALFTQWANKSLSFLDLSSTRDVDNTAPLGPEEDPIGVANAGFRAVMLHSGNALQRLELASCRHISQDNFLDVFSPKSGKKGYESLELLNLSFCSGVDDKVIAAVGESCPSLRRIEVFGCFSISAFVKIPKGVSLIGGPNGLASGDVNVVVDPVH